MVNTNFKPIAVKKETDYVSDHQIIMVCLKTIPSPEITTKFKIRDLTKLSEGNILRIAFRHPKITTLNDVNALHRSIYEKLAPIRTARTRNPTQLVNPRIEKVKKKRDRLLKKYHKTGNENTLIQAKEETKRLKRVI